MADLQQHLLARFALTDKEARNIASHFRPMAVKKKAFFLRSGRRCRQVAFINSGVMRNYAFDHQGNEVVKYMVSDGDFNTVYQYFVRQSPCPENISAVTDCALSVIDYPDFMALKASSESFRAVIDALVVEGLSCKERRLQSYLADDAQQRYENLLAQQPKVVQYAPMRHLASYLGITRETLSRIRSRMVANG